MTDEGLTVEAHTPRSGELPEHVLDFVTLLVILLVASALWSR